MNSECYYVKIATKLHMDVICCKKRCFSLMAKIHGEREKQNKRIDCAEAPTLGTHRNDDERAHQKQQNMKRLRRNRAEKVHTFCNYALGASAIDRR